MIIDLNIPHGLNRQVKEPVLGKKREHVVKKGNSRLDFGTPFTIQKQGEKNLRFTGFSVNGGGSCRHGHFEVVVVLAASCLAASSIFCLSVAISAFAGQSFAAASS